MNDDDIDAGHEAAAKTNEKPWRPGDPYPDWWTSAERLQVASDNPNVGDIDAIAASIRYHGFYNVVFAQTRTGTIIAGNHRFQAGRMVGMERFPVVWLEVDEEERVRLMIADNRYAELSVWNERDLADLLMPLAPNLEGTGYTPDELEALLASLDPGSPTDGEGDDDGFGPSLDVRVTIGGIEFTVPRNAYDEWEQSLIAEAGTDPEAWVDEVRGRLGL